MYLHKKYAGCVIVKNYLTNIKISWGYKMYMIYLLLPIKTYFTTHI